MIMMRTWRSALRQDHDAPLAWRAPSDELDANTCREGGQVSALYGCKTPSAFSRAISSAA